MFCSHPSCRMIHLVIIVQLKMMSIWEARWPQLLQRHDDHIRMNKYTINLLRFFWMKVGQFWLCISCWIIRNGSALKPPSLCFLIVSPPFCIANMSSLSASSFSSSAGETGKSKSDVKSSLSVSLFSKRLHVHNQFLCGAVMSGLPLQFFGSLFTLSCAK